MFDCRTNQVSHQDDSINQLPLAKEGNFFEQKFFFIFLGIFLLINLSEISYYFYLKSKVEKIDSDRAENYIKTKLGEENGLRKFSDKYVGFRGLVVEKNLNSFYLESQNGKARIRVAPDTIIRKPEYGKSPRKLPVYDLQEAPNLTFKAIEIGQVVDVIGISDGNEINALSIVIDNEKMENN